MVGYQKLGEILIKQGVLSLEQLERAIEFQKKENGRLGEILIKMGMVKEQEIISALANQLGLSYVTKSSGLLVPQSEQGLEDLITKDFAQKNLVLPLSRNLNALTCAVVDPLDIILIDNLRKMTNCEINLVIATRSDLMRAIEDFYSHSAMLMKEAVKESYVAPEIVPEKPKVVEEEQGLELGTDKLIERAGEAPVVKLVDLIIRQAIDERSSDIHIEPQKDKISLRYRIDGKLYEIPPPAKHLHLPIVTRIKILSKMDISEKRLPQDGAFIVKVENKVVDLRVSTTPTIYGEKMVIRILDKSSVPLDLGKLGFSPKQLEDFHRALKSPYGLILLTGPTGSGKTTTMYAAMNEIIDPHKNILSIEDPVEYRMDGVNQVQVKTDIGLTFATALRSFLRQDPDIMMVGEIRDLETAQICLRAALTGHLILSTLHTNDAPSAVSRLLDIGIESYLLMPSLLLVIAQRLARRLCPVCKEAYEYKQELIKGFNFTAPIFRPKGCDECNNIGYKGRVAIAELMVVNEEVRSLIGKQASYREIREASRRSGMVSMFESGMKMVMEGTTSIEEVLSVISEGE
ncbi:MAG: GspE/PulE family protein [Candidatus Omnitrophota bacterium]